MLSPVDCAGQQKADTQRDTEKERETEAGALQGPFQRERDTETERQK